MDRLCYHAKSLLYKPLNQIVQEGHLKEVAELKYQHRERRRKQKIHDILDLLKQPTTKSSQIVVEDNEF